MDDLREKLCSAILEAGNIGDADSYRYKMADAALAVFKEWLQSNTARSLVTKVLLNEEGAPMLRPDAEGIVDDISLIILADLCGAIHPAITKDTDT